MFSNIEILISNPFRTGPFDYDVEVTNKPTSAIIIFYFRVKLILKDIPCMTVVCNNLIIDFTISLKLYQWCRADKK